MNDKLLKKATQKTLDIDVVILAVYHFHELCLTEIWVGFGYGKTLKEISIHHIFQQVRTQCSFPCIQGM
jgi:hypothetical protein